MSDSKSTFTIPLILIGVGMVIGVIALAAQSGGSPGNLNTSLTAYATEIGLDIEAFDACMATREPKDEALADYDDGVKLGVNSTPTIFVNGIPVRGAKPFEEFAALIESEIAHATPPNVERIEVGIDDDPVKGNFSAPVTIVEFSDYQCPFCGKFAREIEPQIMKSFVDTGKARYVFRDFPLTSIHENAVEFAASAYCAKEQGKFWEMHDIIFANQPS